MSVLDTLEHLAEPPGHNEIDPHAEGYQCPRIWPLGRHEHSWDVMWRGVRQQAAKRRQQEGN